MCCVLHARGRVFIGKCVDTAAMVKYGKSDIIKALATHRQGGQWIYKFRIKAGAAAVHRHAAGSPTMSFCLAASFHTSIDAANDNARVGRWPALLLSARERVGRRGGNERAGRGVKGTSEQARQWVVRKGADAGGGGDVGKSEDQEWTRKRKVVHERGRVVGAGEGRWAGVASALQMAGGGGLGCSSNPWPLPQLMMELPSWPLGSIAGVHGSLDVLCKTRGDAEYDGPFFHAPVVLTTYYYSVLPAAISPPPSSLLPPTPPLNQAL
ncbi:hypothetical protein BD779DRAFT_1473053 [Infundibulicybe gibba]|nr:hypothetical protein BD779DRAFT_1473053 [Infundibulicybe gibba]